MGNLDALCEKTGLIGASFYKESNKTPAGGGDVQQPGQEHLPFGSDAKSCNPWTAWDDLE